LGKEAPGEDQVLRKPGVGLEGHLEEELLLGLQCGDFLFTMVFCFLCGYLPSPHAGAAETWLPRSPKQGNESSEPEDPTHPGGPG
jgi:hypothetical protein